MTCPVTTCMSLTPPAADSGQAAGLVRKAWRAYWDWRARRVTVMILSSLDARTLRDIGISPGEIESLVQCHDDRRHRRYDASWLWRGR
ncbi:MAG: DUF1127 domain-containing protein [Hyphomicrobiaceae bacterium]